MPYFVNNNAFTAQNASCNPTNQNPAGSYQYRTFGTKCVMASNIDRVVLVGGDGENSTYTSSWWHYSIEDRQFTRVRPDPTDALGFGAFDDSTNGYQDRFGVNAGDNKQVAYNPVTGNILTWGGNASGNVAPNEQDPTWFNHYIPEFGATTGGYLYNPSTHILTMPAMSGWGSITSPQRPRFLSAAQGYDPDFGGGRFLQVMGENGNAGFGSGAYIWSLAGDGSAIALADFWTADNVIGPTNRTNIGHQFAYHSRAKKWLLFGGNTSISPYVTANDLWLWDPSKAVGARWTKLNPTGGPPTARAFGFFTYDTQNNVMILTGGSATGAVPAATPANDTWAYSLEYNTWTNLGVNFGRMCGGAVYDPTRNLHIYTPGNGLGDVDVFTFRYAIPRATPMVTNQWYAVQQPNPAVPLAFWSEKHTTMTYSPVTKRLYQHGGDSNHAIDKNGVDQGASIGSYYQRDFSVDLGARIAAVGSPNTGWREEFPLCTVLPLLRPKHPDFVGWAWDSKRSRFWHVPGEDFHTSAALMNCPIAAGGDETDTGTDEPPFLYRHMMTFDPLAPANGFTDMGTNHGVLNAGSDFPWVACYDPQRDELFRFEQNGDNTIGDGTLFFRRYNITTNTWTTTNVSPGTLTTALRQVKVLYWDWDPQRRHVYFADRQSGHLTRLSMVTNTIVDLGLLPGTPVYAGPIGVVSDKGYLKFDWNARMLVYVELVNGSASAFNRVWKYAVDTAVWAEIGTLTKVTLDGGAFDPTTGTSPDGTTLGFDPDNNVIALTGCYVRQTPYVWVIRLSDMGEPAPPVINPVPNLVSIAPASCVQGDTVAVTAFGTGSTFVTNSVIRWNGITQPTAYVNANTLTFTVTAALSAVVGPHSVTVFNPTPGGGTSLATIFTVTPAGNPTPSLTSLAPSSTLLNDAILCTVTGTSFVATSTVNWDAAPQPTTFLSATQLTFSVSGPLAAVLGAHSVTVTNPAPGGGLSNSLTFTVTDFPPSTQTATFVGSIM